MGCAFRNIDFKIPRISVSFKMNLQIPQNRGCGQEKTNTQSQKLPSLCSRKCKQVKTYPCGFDPKVRTDTNQNQSLPLVVCVHITKVSSNLQGFRRLVWLPLACLFDKLAVDLVLQLWMGETHLESTLGKSHVIIYGWSVNGHVNEELTRL